MCICDHAKNFLQGNVRVTDEQIDKTSPYKQFIRKLGSKTVPMKDKKIIITQYEGAFLLLLIAPILGALVAEGIKAVNS